MSALTLTSWSSLTGCVLCDGQGLCHERTHTHTHTHSHTQELEQLNRIYSVMGTPTEEVWPGVSTLPNAKGASQLPHHAGEQNLNPLQSKLGVQGN